MPPTSLAIEVSGVSKWYGEATALDQVDVAIRRASVHGLVGMNGAGKTTLLAIMLGLVRPDEGVVRLLGRTAANSTAGWLDGVGGFVESPRFYPYLSGRDNLKVLAGLDDCESAVLVDPVLDLVGLRPSAGQKLRGYSLGMRQRLGLAAAIMRRPEVLILDEPTNGLDPGGIRDLSDAIQQLAGQGMTVVMSSHNMAQVERVCDSVTVLDRGRVVFTDSLRALRAIAPNPVWRLVTSDDVAAIETAGFVSAVDVAEHPNGGLLVTAEQSRLDHFVIALGQAGVAVRLLDQAANPLERMLDRLTGHDRSADLADPAVIELPAGSAA